jgi:hypothetical protein
MFSRWRSRKRPQRRSSTQSGQVVKLPTLTFNSAPLSLSSVLAMEMEKWYENLGADGIRFRAFTGITREGLQCITKLSLRDIGGPKARDFLIWLIRRESFVGYAYAFPVGSYDEERKVLKEELEIQASCESESVCVYLRLVGRNGLEAYQLRAKYSDVNDWQPYTKLQFAQDELGPETCDWCGEIWKALRPHAHFRDRSRSPDC